MSQLIHFDHLGYPIYNPYAMLSFAADPVRDFGFTERGSTLIKMVDDDSAVVLTPAETQEDSIFELYVGETVTAGPYKLKQIAHLRHFPEYLEPLPDVEGFVLSTNPANACPLFIWDDPVQRATCVMPTPKVEFWCDYAHPFLREQEGSRYVIRICDIESNDSAIFVEAETLDELVGKLRKWTHANLGYDPEEVWKSKPTDDLGTLIQLTTCYQFRFLGGLPA